MTLRMEEKTKPGRFLAPFGPGTAATCTTLASGPTPPTLSPTHTPGGNHLIPHSAQRLIEEPDELLLGLRQFLSLAKDALNTLDHFSQSYCHIRLLSWVEENENFRRKIFII